VAVTVASYVKREPKQSICAVLQEFFSRRPPFAGCPTIRSMIDVVAYRGPDGQGHLVDGCVALGHRRLAILDLSEAGHQPMHSLDGNASLVFNGEV